MSQPNQQVPQMNQQQQQQQQQQQNTVIINTNLENTVAVPSSAESFQIPSSVSDSGLSRAMSNANNMNVPQMNAQMVNLSGNLGFISRIKRRSRASCISNENSGNLLMYELRHVKRINARKVTCLAITEHRYVTGSLDNTVIVWKNELEKSQIPLSILSKHKSSVNSIDANECCNMIVSVARDGSIVTASLMNGKFIKLISALNNGEPSIVRISDLGTICVSFLQADKSLVKIYDINLNEIGEHLFESRISALCMFDWFDQSEYLAVGLNNKSISILQIPDLKNVWSLEKNDWEASIIQVAPLSKTMFIGTLSGKVFSLKLEDEDQARINNFRMKRKYNGFALTPFETLIFNEEGMSINNISNLNMDSDSCDSQNDADPESSSVFESAQPS